MKLVKVDFSRSVAMEGKNIFELGISNDFIRNIGMLLVNALKKSIIGSSEAGDDLSLLLE